MGERALDVGPGAAARRPSARASADRGGGWIALQAVLAGSLVLLFLLPLYALFTYAPLARIADAAQNSGVRAALWVTLLASGLAVLVAVVLGVPFGFLLARRRFPGRTWLEAFVGLPIVVPHLMVGLGLFLLFLPGAPLDRAAVAVGFPVYDAIWGVVLVMVFVSAPYTVIASTLSFRAVDPRTVEAARALGAGPAEAFWTVTLPIAARGIIAGLLLTWARAVSEIGGLLVLASYVYPGGPYRGPVAAPISVYVYNLFQNGDLADAAAVSSLFLLLAFAIFVAVRFAERARWVPWNRGEVGP